MPHIFLSSTARPRNILRENRHNLKEIHKIGPAIQQDRDFQAGHLLDASGERTIFSMTEVRS